MWYLLLRLPPLKIVCIAAEEVALQRRVAADAAIETLSISFELFENEICSAGVSPILSELVEDKISPQASVSRHLRPRRLA